MKPLSIRGRKIGPDYSPFVIAEIGINHEGDFGKFKKMVDDAAAAGCECVKIQSHVVADEMAPAAKKVIPGNAKESIWNIMERCAFTEEQEIAAKQYVEKKGMIFLSTPFSRAAAVRLEKMGVEAYKIGSGECNNYPLIEHIASYGKPIILSTGMNNIESIKHAVKILEKNKIPYALLHCTSIYPTPYAKIRLNAIKQLANIFPNAVLGLSDHSNSIYPCLGAVALGASILERHFTSNKRWPGPDIAISMSPAELSELICASDIIHQALIGVKDILPEEQPTIDFAYACVVAIKDITCGEKLTKENIWVKRPGTGEIKAKDYNKVLGRKTLTKISSGSQLHWKQIAT